MALVVAVVAVVVVAAGALA